MGSCLNKCCPQPVGEGHIADNRCSSYSLKALPSNPVSQGATSRDLEAPRSVPPRALVVEGEETLNPISGYSLQEQRGWDAEMSREEAYMRSH